MTEENYQYRTSQQLLRNQFPGKGKWKIPVIPKAEFSEEEFRDLLLIGFDKTKLEDDKHLDRIVHFFLYDYKFERVWKQPDTDIEKLFRYRAVLSPDFSMYLEMAPVMQLYNAFRNRWCGAYWASKGMRVIPTINWGDESTFDFCFEGVERGSIVAVSTYMASAHGNREDQKKWFMVGYNEMLHRIEPEKIICYNTPFPEMQGDIVFVDYDKSSWRHMDEDKSAENEGTLVRKTGYIILPERDTIAPYHVELGGGSAYGGKWRPNPNKPQDMVFVGPPNTIQRIFMPTSKGGFWLQVKYDADGKAAIVRHETEHAPGSGHSNPHDHTIDWSSPDQHPTPSSPINYTDGNIPEFKCVFVKGNDNMNSKDVYDAYKFNTIAEFKTSMRYGAEVVIEWEGHEFGIWSENGKIRITATDNTLIPCVYDCADDALEFVVCGNRLRDIIRDVHVIYRSI